MKHKHVKSIVSGAEIERILLVGVQVMASEGEYNVEL